MPDPALDVGDDLPGIELIPAPVKVLGDCPKLDNEVSREVLRLDLTAFLPPQPHQGDLIIAHDDPGVGAADEARAYLLNRLFFRWAFPLLTFQSGMRPKSAN